MDSLVRTGTAAAVLACLFAGGSARAQSPPTVIEVFHGAQLAYTATFPADAPPPSLDVYHGVRKAYSVPVPVLPALPVGAGEWFAPAAVAAAETKWWEGDPRPRPAALPRVPGWEAFAAGA